MGTTTANTRAKTRAPTPDKRVSEYLCESEWNSAVCEQVGFVADEQRHAARLSVLSQLFEPATHVLEGLLLCHVVDDDHALRAAVVHGRQCAELLLARCVPLQRTQTHTDTLIYSDYNQGTDKFRLSFEIRDQQSHG